MTTAAQAQSIFLYESMTPSFFPVLFPDLDGNVNAHTDEKILAEIPDHILALFLFFAYFEERVSHETLPPFPNYLFHVKHEISEEIR